MSLARPTGLPVLFLVLSCAASREPVILPELSARKPVCLALDWSTGLRPNYSGRPAPDTLLLLPERGDQAGFPAEADLGGKIALSPSQRDREGAGWSWWTVGDTLMIRGWSVTEEDLGIETDKGMSVEARWAGGDAGTGIKSGTVGLHPYKCNSLPEPAP